VEVQLQNFLTSVLGGGEWSDSHSGHFNPGDNAPDTHSLGGCLGPRGDLGTLEKRQICIQWELNHDSVVA